MKCGMLLSESCNTLPAIPAAKAILTLAGRDPARGLVHLLCCAPADPSTYSFSQTIFLARLTIFLTCLALWPGPGVQAHGGVFLEDDLCVIQIGFYKAHFKIYQPQRSQHEELCEDIPHADESVFVLEYLHDSMREVPVEFRIIRDVENRGRFVRWDDIKNKDVSRDTVFYQPPRIRQDGVFLALHEFTEEGNYIGIVSASNPGHDDTYTAVFPFRVGGADWGTIPWFIALAVFLQLNYWLMSGGYARIRKVLKT